MNKESPVFRSLEIIESRIAQKLSVENIAQSVSFSKYHYQRLFHEIVGESVMEYVTKRKMSLAGRALLETNDTVLNIALRFGYDSHEGFTRGFKAYMGVTPTDYRKYGLAAIFRKTAKGRNEMTYSKTTDEIVRQLNGFIVTAKETANNVRKKGLPQYAPFWNEVADETDALAGDVQAVLRRLSAIAEHPDEITNRFVIIKAVEDAAVRLNILAFNAYLLVSRGQPDHVRAQMPLCESYRELARVCAMKAQKASSFLSELSKLIFDDMRVTAAEKMREIVRKGNEAAESIQGYSYIKDEVSALSRGLSQMSFEDVTASSLEDYMFKLNIISFAASMDVLRRPEHKPVFDGLYALKESLGEAIDFFGMLPQPAPETEPLYGGKYFSDIVFQGNILLFYTRGEVSYEKLGHLLDDGQKAAFDEIIAEIQGFIDFAHAAAKDPDYATMADILRKIHSRMMDEADKLNGKGGVIRFLAQEFKRFGDSVANCPSRHQTDS